MKVINLCIFFFFLLVLAGNVSCLGQTLTTAADRDKIVIGEQIRFTIKAEGIARSQHVINWADIPDTINHLEVVERGAIDTIDLADGVIYQQSVTLTSFDSGQWQIPAVQVHLRSDDNKDSVLSSMPVTVNVVPVDISQLKDYHDIKEIVEVEDTSSKWILIGVALGTLISIIVVWMLARKKVKVMAPVASPINQNPADWALTALDDLQKKDLPSKGQVKEYYQQLTNVCREYFYMQLRQASLHQTTDEWMLSLQPLPIEKETKISFFQFIRLADSVKFAKYLPPAGEHEQSMKAARQMIVHVSDWQRSVSLNPKTTS